MRKLPPLAALRAFEAAARHLSFKRAADELGVTPPAISHQVRLLEEILGQRLFVRGVRRVALSPAGVKLLPALSESFDDMARAVEAARAAPASRTVTITATVTLTAAWLVPRLGAFRREHPGIDLAFLASNDLVGFGPGGADIALRYGAGRYPGCRSERLFDGVFAPVAAPSLGLTAPDELRRHPLIQFAWSRVEADTPIWARWFAERGLSPDAAAGGELAFSDESHALQAALDGQGVMLANLALVADQIARGALVIPFGPVLAGHGVFMVTSNAHPLNEAGLAVEAWLKREAAAFAPRLADLVASAPA